MREKVKEGFSKVLTAVLCLAIASSTALTTVNATDGNEESFSTKITNSFRNPEMDYRPEARWWLAEGSHTDQTLLESIHELYDSGFGAIEFVTLNESSLDQQRYAWGSEEWIHDSQFIIKECTKLGMGVSFTSGTHWGTANLISINPDQEAASQELGYNTVDIAAGENYNGALPTPQLPGNSTKMNLVKVVVAKKQGSSQEESVLLDEHSLADITQAAYQNQNGIWNIEYTAPADGEYTLFAFWQYGTSEIFSPSIGDSYTINYFSEEGANALIEYWQEHVLTSDIRDIIRENGDVSLYMDSLELNTKGKNTTGNLWCSNYLEEFEARRGYDLSKYLPLMILENSVTNLKLTGYQYEPASGDDFIEKIRRDMYQTNTELYSEKCLDVLREWLYTFGMTLRAENSYGQLFEISQPVKSLDYVETESLEFFSEIDRFRGQSGAAHLYDKLYSSETGAMLGSNYWYDNDYFRQIFYTQFASGIQRTVLHGYSSEYGPEQSASWPGYEGMFPFYSERFNKRQPNAIDYPALTAHIARLQKALRRGTIQMDLGILRSDYFYNCSYWQASDPYDQNNMRQHKGIYWQDTTLQDAGYTYDYFSPVLLQDKDITCTDGLVQADGAAYQALILFQEEMPYESAQVLLEWAKSGLPIVIVDGPTEELIHTNATKYNQQAAVTTGFYDGKDEQLATVMGEMKQLDNVAVVQTQKEAYDALIGLGVHPRAEYLDQNQQNLLSVLRKDEDASYLYLYNYMYTDTQNYEGQISLDGLYRPYILDTWSGEVTQASSYSYKNGRTILDVNLEPGEVITFALDPNDIPDRTVSNTSDSVLSAHLKGNTATLCVSQSGKASLDLSDGRKIEADVTVPENIELTDWSLTVEGWTPGEKQTRTEDRGLGYTTVEATYTTNKTEIEVGKTALKPWKEIEAVGSDISGVGTYTHTFALPAEWDFENNGAIFKAESFSGGTAAVFVNGIALPVNMDNGTIDVSSALKLGENTIQVRVTSSLRNRLIETGFGFWFTHPNKTVDDYGMVGTTELITYTKVPVTIETAEKDILNSVIAYAEQTKASGEYDNAIASVQKSFKAALDNAKAVSENTAASQKEVDEAWMTLLNEIHKLGFVAGNKDSLNTVIQAAEKIRLDQYTDAGKEEFIAALEAATTVYMDVDAMQQEINEVESDLLTAMLNLRLKADKSILKEMLAAANSIDANAYTAESYMLLQAAAANAHIVLANDNAAQDEVDSATASIQTAMDGLVTATNATTTAGNNVAQTGQEAITAKTDSVKTGDFSPIAGLVAITLAGAALFFARKKR